MRMSFGPRIGMTEENSYQKAASLSVCLSVSLSTYTYTHTHARTHTCTQLPIWMSDLNFLLLTEHLWPQPPSLNNLK